jgi:gas vesicle protein
MTLSWACAYSPAVGAGVGAAAALSAMCCVVAPSAGRQSRSKKRSSVVAPCGSEQTTSRVAGVS